MSKKKFSQTNVGKFLLEKIPNIVSSIAGDTPVGSVVKALIGGSDMSDQPIVFSPQYPPNGFVGPYVRLHYWLVYGP